MVSKWSSAMVAVIAVGVVASNAQGTVVLSENFEGYADTAALQAAWTTVSGGLALNTTGFTPTPTPLAPVSAATTTKLGRFNASQLAYRSLSQTVASDADWSITLNVLSEGYGRSNGFALTSADGTQGYAVRWNATNVNQNTGRGVVQILEVSSSSLLGAGAYGTLFNSTGTTPHESTTPGSGSANSFHPVTGYRVTAASGTNQSTQATYESTWNGFNTITLTYTAATGTLRLFTSGVDNANPSNALVTAVDSSPANFSFGRFYLIGQNANFDNIVVDAVVPEPAALGGAGLLGLALLRRRRRAD